MTDDTLFFATPAEWERWLDSHHQTSPGVSVRFAKVHTGRACIPYPAALELALCFGWIDALRRSDGPDYYLQRFAPRKPRSIWSVINRERALALIASGKMRPAGLLEVERAKANGRWENAYGGRQTITVPPDFIAALEANPKAKATFAALNGQNRFAFLFRLQTALKPETRAKRLKTFVDMLNHGRTLHPQPAGKPAAKKKATRKPRKPK
jgi:uncharacterized protein YdeI (YjbR/CyaY-like superfamily)